MPPLIGEGRWISAGVEKFGAYFRRKGWLGDEESGVYRWWGRGEGTTRWIVECVFLFLLPIFYFAPLFFMIALWSSFQ